MNIRAVFHLLSYLIIMMAFAVLICWGISKGYDDPPKAQHGLLVSAGIVFGFGLLLCLLTRGEVDLSRRDGFGIVVFGWLLAALLGSLPFILTGAIPDVMTALFETMSGFTTTGASALKEIEALPKGVLFWRSMTQWLGGMGVLVLCVAVLPFLGVGGMQIYRAEMPGPAKERLTPRITTTAKLLWGIYLLLTLVQTGLLMAGGLGWFDALCHSFTTIATAGFSTKNESIAAFNSYYVEIIIVIFMFLSGINFALHFRALRGHVGCYFKDPEFRFFLGM
ncbi:MAG: potassium transporter TrkG, partial [Verrucomicrobiota bacterium]